MTTDAVLLDSNVVIALSVSDHEHHDVAAAWLGEERRFATCPITQGALARFVVRVATAELAVDVLDGLTRNPRHEFWPDSVAFDDGVLRGVIGHRQVTDAYLTALASARESRLATFDNGLATLRPEVVELIPR